MMKDIDIYNDDILSNTYEDILSIILFPNVQKHDEQNKKHLNILRIQSINRNFSIQNEVWSNEYIGAETGTEIGTEEGKSPFEELYNKRSSEDKIRGVIEEVRRIKLVPYTDRIVNRLQYLLETTLDDPEENDINPDSLNAFLAFMKSRKGLKYPDITLSPAGNITGRWRKDTNRNLCIEFLSIHEAQFVVFAPNPNRTLRITGIIPIDELWNILKPYRVNRWVVNK